MVYIITTWYVSSDGIIQDSILTPSLHRYTRHEVQTRYILFPFLTQRFLILAVHYSLAAFYIVGILVGGFSAIFAYVLTLLGGRYGIAGWAWIFVSSCLHIYTRY